MRIAITTLAVLVLTFGAFSLASGDDKKDEKRANKALVKMRAQLEALQMEVSYLRQREAAVSGYVLKNEARGRGLKAVVTRIAQGRLRGQPHSGQLTQDPAWRSRGGGREHRQGPAGRLEGAEGSAQEAGLVPQGERAQRVASKP